MRNGPTCRRRLAMRGIDPALVLAFQDRVRSNLGTVFEDSSLVGVVLDLDDPLPRRIRDAVEIAVDRDHPLVADPPLDGRDGAVGDRRQHRQARPFFGESLFNDAPGRGVDPRVGDRLAPAVKLSFQVLECPEGPSEEEVLPDVAERALDLSLRLGPLWPTGPRDGTVMVQKRDQTPPEIGRCCACSLG